MSLQRDYPGFITLLELQAILFRDEASFGPIDSLQVSGTGNLATTSVVFDTAISLESAISTLSDATIPFPASNVAFVRGQCVISGVAKNLTALMQKQENLLISRCLSFFQSFGWSRTQALGLVASIKFESDFSPTASGDNGTAYGLCQWRGSRQTDFATALHGTPIVGSTFREQLEFIIWELGHTEHVAGDLLRNTTSVTDAARVVCVQYERPKNPVLDSGSRIAFAATLEAQLTQLV